VVGANFKLVKSTARGLAIAVLALFLLACESRADIYPVIKVQDGDSFIVKAGGQRRKVRIAAIDAPEYGQPYGEQSKQNLKGLLQGSEVHLEVIKTDDYGRWVARVWVVPASCVSDKNCKQSVDAGLFQIESGLAWWYRYWAKVRKEQSLADQKQYERAEAVAKTQKLGLWRDANPVNPRQWRKSHLK
jgi:endonuclease YncB( thermonuclease family)